MHYIRALLTPSRWGLRVRSALTAAVVVGVVLLIGGIALVWLLYRSLIASVDSAASTRADNIVAELGDTAPAELNPSLFTADHEIEMIQVVDASGKVLRASAGAPDRPLIKAPASGDATGMRATGVEDMRVSARTAGTYVVLVGASSESVEEALHKVAIGLAIGGPLITIAATAATYELVGRSLGSVEAIRARVAEIGADRLAERVPVPVAQDEIARLAETMNAMLGRVEAGHIAQRRFVGDASHELRSPLATLIAALEVAREHPQALDRALITTTLLPEAERMRLLIDDLLTLATVDEQGLTLRVTDVDLDDVAATVADALRHQHEFDVVTDLRPARLTGDPTALARVIRNLTDNAATHTASVVAISTDSSGTAVRLIVDDDGPGIPAAERSRVFDRFVRLQSDRARATGGAGLGLAIVDQIVAAHHGTISIEDAPRGGARIIVTLPVGSQSSSHNR